MHFATRLWHEFVELLAPALDPNVDRLLQFQQMLLLLRLLPSSHVVVAVHLGDAVVALLAATVAERQQFLMQSV